MGFKSADWAGQDISWRMCCSSLLLKYLWQFSCMVCVVILQKYNSLTHKPRSRWYRLILQHAVIAGLIQFTLHLVQIPDFVNSKSIPLQNKASLILYSWCDTERCGSFSNSSPHKDTTIWLKDFELLFVSRKDFIPLLYCPFFVHYGPMELFDIDLFPQQWFLNSNSAI